MKRFELIPSPEYPEYDTKITLKPCYRCNQCCWYCPEYDNKSNMWTLEQCDRVINTLAELPDDKRSLFIYFYGGEPTLSEHWEYLHFKLSERLLDRSIFFQTQTNMSIDNHRLSEFLKAFNSTTPEDHTVDICNSYHIDKQPVEEYIERMDICNEFDALGLCFFSTEIPKEDQMMSEFAKIAAKYPDKLKLKFTVLPNLRRKYHQSYGHLFDDEYLMGDDSGEYIEYRYYMRKYPELKQYLEEGWNFDVDGKVLNYAEVINNRLYESFRYKKCTAGRKGMVISHDLNVYHCNDDFENNINAIALGALDISTYLKKDVRCLNCQCWDGLDFMKYEA